MSIQDSIAILNSNDNVAKVKLLQKMVKEKSCENDSLIIESVKRLCENEDIAVRFWAKKVSSNFVSKHSETLDRQPEEEENLTLEVLLKKLYGSPSHFVANEVIQKILEKKEETSYVELVKYLKACSDSIVISFLVKNLCIAFPSENTLAVVLPFLKHSDDRVVANCVEGLGFIPSPKATLLINQMLSHENHRIRANAAKALANKEPETTKKVIKLMLQAQDKPHFVIAACYAIKELRLEEFLPDLSGLILKPILSEASISAILNIGGEIALGYLEPFYPCEDKDVNVRLEKAIEKLKFDLKVKSLGQNIGNVLKDGKESLGALGKSIVGKLKSANEELKNKADQLMKSELKNEDPWFYFKDSEKFGPFSEKEIRELFEAGEIDLNTPVTQNFLKKSLGECFGDLQSKSFADSQPSQHRLKSGMEPSDTKPAAKSKYWDRLNNFIFNFKPKKFVVADVPEYIVSNSSEVCSLPCFFMIMGFSFIGTIIGAALGFYFSHQENDPMIIPICLGFGLYPSARLGNFLGGYCRSFSKYLLALIPSFLVVAVFSLMLWEGSALASITNILVAISVAFAFYDVSYCENCKRKFVEKEIATLENVSVHKLLSFLDEKLFPLSNQEVLEYDEKWPLIENQKQLKITAKCCPICLDSVINVHITYKGKEQEKAFGVPLPSSDSSKLIFSKFWRGSEVKDAFNLKKMSDY